MAFSKHTKDMDILDIEIIVNGLARNIVQKVLKNLNYPYINAGFHYNLMTSTLSKAIEFELFNILSSCEQLTTVQKSILKNLTSEELKLIQNKIAGNIISNPSFNGLTKTYLNCSAITNIYFDSLQFNVIKFALNAFYYKPTTMEQLTFYATKDVLKDNFEERRKRVLFIFFSEIGKLSTPEDIELLWKEIECKKHKPLIMLQEPRNPLTKWCYDSEGDKTADSAIFYFNTILHLYINYSYHYWNLIGSVIFKTNESNKRLPDDVGKYIIEIGFFNSAERKQLAKTLPLVNKTGFQICLEERATKDKYEALYRY
ncbi:MAG: hypothetical protein H0U70_10165 [Tatlockia sp.]|nr:hypothetical protein [Tatlockia sp.]